MKQLLKEWKRYINEVHFIAKLYDQDPEQVAERTKRIKEILATLPLWATKELKTIRLIPEKHWSLYSNNSQVAAEYIPNLKEIWIQNSISFGGVSSSIESVLMHEIGHHVFRTILNKKQRASLRSRIINMDSTRASNYNSTQYAEEEFAEAFSFMYSVPHLSSDSIAHTTKKLWPEAYETILQLVAKDKY